MSNVKFYIGLILILITGLLSAAYLEFIPTTITQPDGTSFECFASGDEFFNRLHDQEGFTIIQSQVDGYYYYAAEINDQLVPSSYLVDSVNPATVGLIPHLIISQAEYQARRDRYYANVRDDSRAPTTGTLNNLVVYIRFSDQSEFTSTRMFYDDKFNSEDIGVESMYNYYQEVSYQQLFINSHHYPECEMTTNLSYQDSNPRNYYCPYNPQTNPIGYQNDYEKTQREHQLLANAIAFIAPEVPVSLDIDGDDDGEVDNVCFIIRGGNGNWADLLWAHRWSLYSMFVYLNGKRVYGYTFQPETQVDVSTLNHEMFHALGAPDLYHYSDGGGNPNGPFSRWDIMNGANVHMSAYMKYYYGNWINEIPEITEPGTYSLNPLTEPDNNCFKIASPNSSSEYFVVEYRKQVPNTFEMNIPGSGLIVSRVNTNLAGQGNSNGPPDELYLFRPGGTPTSSGDVNIAHFSSDFGRTEFNNNTDPYCFLCNGDLGGIFIHQVGTAGDYIEFIFDPQIGFFDGHVSSDNPDVDITETEITIDGITIHPNPLGNYAYAHYEGTYDISAYLHGHSVDVEEIVILPFENVTVNFELYYLDPPYQLDYELDENNATLTWQFDSFGNENFDQFNVYRKILDYSYTLIGTTTETVYETIINPQLEYSFYVTAEYVNGISDSSNIVVINSSSSEPDDLPLVQTSLAQNHPNPFNPQTAISYALGENGQVQINIFNLKGEIVRHLVDTWQDTGNHSIIWDGSDDSGKKLSSGLYLYKLNTTKSTIIKKMLMLK